MYAVEKLRFQLFSCSVLEITIMVITNGCTEMKVGETLCTFYGNIFTQKNSKCCTEIQYQNRCFVIVNMRKSELKLWLFLLGLCLSFFPVKWQLQYYPSILLWKINKYYKDLAYCLVLSQYAVVIFSIIIIIIINIPVSSDVSVDFLYFIFIWSCSL